MLKHYFKLVWNKRKRNLLLLVEMFVSFLVIFGVFSALSYFYNNYRRPTGFDYEDVWVVWFFNHQLKFENADSGRMVFENFRSEIEAMPETAGMSFVSSNAPFSHSTWRSNIDRGDNSIQALSYSVDENYERVLKPELVAGEWFASKHSGGKRKPLVLNETAKEKLFPGEGAIGKEVEQGVVIGVIKDMKDKGDFEKEEAAVYEWTASSEHYYKSPDVALIRVKPGADAAFESRLYEAFSRKMRGGTIEIEYLTEKRKSMNYITLIPLMIVGGIVSFLVINVALGLFGVLWYNINQRRQEIGLRRAIGASAGDVSRQVLFEAMLLITLAVVLGLFFAVQFPLLQLFDLPAGVYWMGMGLAVAFMYLLVAVCALYPGKVATGILPAVALHED